MLALDEHGPFRLRPVMRGDANAIAPFLRESDLLDIAATAIKPPFEAILASLASSDRAFAMDFRDQCVAVLGTGFRSETNGTYIWLIGSEKFDEALKSGGWRLCKPWFELAAGEAAKLFTVLPEANRRDVRWLAWLGFREEARIEDFRGLGHTCVRMVLHRKTEASPARPTTRSPAAPAGAQQQPAAASAIADLKNITREPAFEAVLPHNFASTYNANRFADPTTIFDDLIAQATEADRNADRESEIGGEFDIEREAAVEERLIFALQTNHVASRLTEPAQRARFVSRSLHYLFSSMLYTEQAAVSISASLCLSLRDPGTQRFVAIQTAQEARHASALARYIEARWDGPVPCPTELKALYTELILAPEVYKKIVGLHMLFESVGLSAYAILHDGARDPSIRRLMRALLADAISHHRFGEIWCGHTLPRVSHAEMRIIEEWCTRCFRTLMKNAMSPQEQRKLYSAFDLDADVVQQEMVPLLLQQAHAQDALGLAAVFRDTARTLKRNNLIGEHTIGFYASFFDLELGSGSSLERARSIVGESRNVASAAAAR